MDKTGEIKPGVTPPEQGADGEKLAAEQLESHVARRAAEAAKQAMDKESS